MGDVEKRYWVHGWFGHMCLVDHAVSYVEDDEINDDWTRWVGDADTFDEAIRIAQARLDEWPTERDRDACGIPWYGFAVANVYDRLMDDGSDEEQMPRAECTITDEDRASFAIDAVHLSGKLDALPHPWRARFDR